jgi:hypothetical protein
MEHEILPSGSHYSVSKVKIETEETEQTDEEKAILMFEKVCIWFRIW